MNNNPKGHNQYTNNDSKAGSGTKQTARGRNDDGQSTKKSGSSSSKSSSGKSKSNNPEGHNQYSK